MGDVWGADSVSNAVYIVWAAEEPSSKRGNATANKHSGHLFHLPTELVVRDHGRFYPINAEKWHSWHKLGQLHHFSAKWVTEHWKPAPAMIVVARRSCDPANPISREYDWYVRFQLSFSRHTKVMGVTGGTILWRLHAREAGRLCEHFKKAQDPENPSSLTTHYTPADETRNASETQRLVEEVHSIEHFRGRLLLAACKPRDCSMSVDSALAKCHRLRHDRLDRSMCRWRGPTVQKRSRGRCRCGPTAHFEVLGDDCIGHIAGMIAEECVNSASHSAHRVWRQMRSVNRAFREAADRAAVAWVRRATALLTWVEESEELAHVWRLRSHFEPTGLSLMSFVGEARTSGCDSPDDRELLCVYMRLRRMDDDPQAAPPPSHVRMSILHGRGDGRLTTASYGTRAKCANELRVCMHMRVPWERRDEFTASKRWVVGTDL